MKKLFLLVAVALISTATMAQFKSAGLQAAGLTCAMCTKAINTSLEKLPFIQSVDVDIKSSTFIVNFKNGQEVDIDGLKKAVEDAGFSVAKLTLNGHFEPVQVKNDSHVRIGNRTFHFLNIQPQQLQGDRSLVLVDKDFVSAKDFKKISAASKMSCVQTGKAGSCCVKEGIGEQTRIYHVTI